MKPVVHIPVYASHGFRRALCGSLGGMLGETHYDADCARCIIERETAAWEVVEIIEAGPEAEIISAKLREATGGGA